MKDPGPLSSSLPPSSPLKIGAEVLALEGQALLQLSQHLLQEEKKPNRGAETPFSRAVHLIRGLGVQGKLVLTGIGKSGQIARKLASTFSSTGTPAFFLHPAESSHGDLGMISTSDLVLAISYGGGSQELTPLIAYLVRKKIPLIGMTGNAQSDLALNSTIVLNIHVEQEACPLGLAPTTSTTVSLGLGDALAMAVMEARGFSHQDFAQLHPGGSLGIQLAKVREMTPKTLPLLPETAPLKQVLMIMSQGSTRGVVGIIDSSENLVGVITDGDLRRHLDSWGSSAEASSTFFQKTAGDLMSRNPRTIDAGDWVQKALQVMEEHRINLLFVLDRTSLKPQRPLGILHIQDILQSGKGPHHPLTEEPGERSSK